MSNDADARLRLAACNLVCMLPTDTADARRVLAYANELLTSVAAGPTETPRLTVVPLAKPTA